MSSIDGGPILTPKAYSDVRKAPLSILWLDGLFCEWLRVFFSDEKHIFFEQVKDKIWSPNVEETKIKIEPVYKWTPELIDYCPAILIRRGEWKQNTHGIYAGTVTYGQGKAAEVAKTWTGSHSFLAVSKNPAETEALVFEAAKCFSDHKKEIARFCRLNMFDVVGIGPLSVVSDTAEPIYVSELQTIYLFSDFTKILQ